MRDQSPERDPGVAGLFSEVLSGVGRLVQGELRLARAEAVDSLRSVGSGLAKLAAAAVIALVALNLLAGAAVAALAQAGLGPVGAALAVGVVLALVALLLALAGRSALQLRGSKPRRVLDSLRRDAQAVKAGLNEEGTPHV
jgi:hypothetical protein